MLDVRRKAKLLYINFYSIESTGVYWRKDIGDNEMLYFSEVDKHLFDDTFHSIYSIDELVCFLRVSNYYIKVNQVCSTLILMKNTKVSEKST